jgi:predicted nucleic acid-binding Zn ribbon protein
MADDGKRDDKKYHPKKTGQKRVGHLTQVSDVLQGLLQNSKSQLSDGFIRWRLEQEWATVVGPTISKQTVPCAFERGTLFIYVKHPAWAQELRFFTDSIKEKVNTHLGPINGHPWARDVKFTLSRRAAVTEPGNSGD